MTLCQIVPSNPNAATLLGVELLCENSWRNDSVVLNVVISSNYHRRIIINIAFTVFMVKTTDNNIDEIYIYFLFSIQSDR